jgi:hypothetical protein
MLEDLKVIPKLESEFRKVYVAMGKARENGDLPIDAFIDTTRYTLGELQTYQSVENQLGTILHYLGHEDFIGDAKVSLSIAYFFALFNRSLGNLRCLNLIIHDFFNWHLIYNAPKFVIMFYLKILYVSMPRDGVQCLD